MSPVIRKWGMRGTALLSVLAIAFTGTALTYAAFGQSLDAGIANPGTWFKWVNEFGLPLVAWGVFLVLGIWAIRAVWTFLKPLVEAEFSERRLMIKKQGDFAENANGLLTKSVAADESNGILIKETHGLVKEIHGEIVK